MSKKQPKKPRSRQVEAWIYEVINPLVEVALPQENTLLREHNWTWRHFSKQCEFIAVVKNNLPFGMWPIYEEFCEKYPEAARRFAEHDQTYTILSQQISALFVSLCASPEFRNTVDQCLQTWTSDNPQFSGAYPEEKFPLFMAENVVNNIQKLPSYYADAQFWQRFGREIRQLVSPPLVQQLSRTGEDLHQANLELIGHLRGIRSELCDQYDIPPARIPGSARGQLLIAPDFA